MLNINISGRNGVPSPGVYREAGKCGNLPSGEAYIAPLEDGSDGEMIIDGSMVGIGKLESPLHMTISGGKLRSVTGEKSENLDILLKNEINGTVCELGIGTNEAAILNGIILEDEKSIWNCSYRLWYQHFFWRNKQSRMPYGWNHPASDFISG